jgi:uncharacterized protein (DUF58 family)
LNNEKQTSQATYLDKWLDERFPESTQVTLNIKRIFIIPTLISGTVFIALGILLLMAINFQNSLIYGLAFWLLALIVISIFFTYRNLSGVTFKAVQSNPCFAGEKAVFELEVSCSESQKKSAISVGWKNQDLAKVDLQDHHNVRIKLSHETTRRGIFKPDKLSIFTVYPIGLVVAWSYAVLGMQSIVYPEPILQKSAENDSQGVDDDAEQGKEIARGSTDFSGIREYQIGDSPKHIHWGAYAKTGKAYTKTFADYANQDLWLEWDSLALAGVETKLSHLCAKVLQFHQEQQVYGLKIPGKTIQPSSGEAHKTLCLTALALYGNA